MTLFAAIHNNLFEHFNLGEIQNHSLEIIKGNTILNAGSELQLKCNIGEDVSNITFKWLKDNSEILAETSQMLTINNITKDQAGVYHCSAKNGTDTAKSSTKLNITVNCKFCLTLKNV